MSDNLTFGSIKNEVTNEEATVVWCLVECKEVVLEALLHTPADSHDGGVGGGLILLEFDSCGAGVAIGEEFVCIRGAYEGLDTR